jgi:ankyrin repeat protein
MESCIHGHLEIVKILIANGADVNGCDDTGKTPLISACIGNKLDVVRLLVMNGAGVRRCDDEGMTPILMARHNTDIVNFLTEHI